MQNFTRPTLLLDEDLCRANIRRMATKARKHDLRFKPHMKTHQSNTVGSWIKDAGVSAITVSSVEMAQYFASDGWDDITIAFPCNVGRIQEIDKLASSVSLTVLVNQHKTAQLLEKHLTNTVNAYIEIDTGSSRSGLTTDHITAIEELIETIEQKNHISWVGFYSHPGHSYQCRSQKEIEEVQISVVSQFKQLKSEISPKFESFEICSGDTPCCSVAEDFGPIDAMSPGNFVFYDLMQNQIGSCDPTQIAVAVTCPVVDKYPNRNELIIHGGAIHFSKESITENGHTHFGKLAIRTENHWQLLDDRSRLVKLSQEHGVVRCSNEVFNNYGIGDSVTILPVHSCLTADLMGQYQLVNENETTVDMMK